MAPIADVGARDWGEGLIGEHDKSPTMAIVNASTVCIAVLAIGGQRLQLAPCVAVILRRFHDDNSIFIIVELPMIAVTARQWLRFARALIVPTAACDDVNIPTVLITHQRWRADSGAIFHLVIGEDELRKVIHR